MADNKGKGCSFTQITKYVLKRENFDAFEALLPKDELIAKMSEVLTPFIDYNGKKSYHDAGIVYAMYKKVAKQKHLIAIAIIKRVAGEPEKKKGLEALFANSTDTYELTAVRSKIRTVSCRYGSSGGIRCRYRRRLRQGLIAANIK